MNFNGIILCDKGHRVLFVRYLKQWSYSKEKVGSWFTRAGGKGEQGMGQWSMESSSDEGPEIMSGCLILLSYMF